MALIRIWVTKYLFTRGIIECDGEVSDELPMIATIDVSGTLRHRVRGNAWHRTPEAAKKWAHTMISKKRISLAKQLSALMTLEKELG